MTGLMQSLALRGAGLAPAGVQPLRLRPRSLFAPGAPAGDGEGAAGLEGPAAEAPAPSAFRVPIFPSVQAGRPEAPRRPAPAPDGARADVAPSHPPAPSLALGDAPSPPPVPEPPRVSPHEEIAERAETSSRQAAGPPSAATAPALEHPTPRPPEQGATPPPPRAAPPPTAPIREAAFEAPWEQPDLAAEAPPFSLSIGRIDVEFVHPPPPPVRAAPAPDGRTRGFAAYARVRRGSPR